MGEFIVKKDDFVLNGEPIRLISGAIHYFRVVPEYWRDRLLKLKACGFNTVETYIPWNFHEPKKGQFQFEGMADVAGFIRTAGEVGLHVIVRPSPYICAEWEFGGLPAWLLADPGMKIRCNHKPYLEHVDAYYDVLLPILKPLLITNGGPIIAMQIENEYGSYGNDTSYLVYLQQSMVQRGIDVLLFTSDGPEDFMLQGGMVPGVLETVNFGSRSKEAFDALRKYQPEGPLMCMEYWNGWFDHWGEEHHTRDADDAAANFDEMMSLGASVNFYMFHGGTNFGYMSGANCFGDDSRYEPTITSYDYDVSLNESGEPTDKYFKVREVVGKYVDLPELELPAPIAKAAYGKVAIQESAGLFAQLNRISTPIQTAAPETMEALGQNDGFIVYETFISGPRGESELTIQDCHDRAIVFLDDQYMGVIERWDASKKVAFSVPAGGAKLRIILENMGRINYGPFMMDRKGITEGVRHGNAFLFGWTTYCLQLDNAEGVAYGTASLPQEPTFNRAILNIEGTPADTFLLMEEWSKGVVYVNGFNIGRYWNRGPQQTLYIPAPLLRQGDNEIVVLELHPSGQSEIEFTDQPILASN
ncbi:glycoside hydrolase family 35 protein [Paenibacillus guangzhouensis]|uniref:glycoside hydrolase family 35 protein n=1 Tax=Paenibacillus guangzhouensis TaxID=1473112 RepID=UPI001267738D|nr:beta-galactosidase family protein [Paenibacillus guangzhouensis]